MTCRYCNQTDHDTAEACPRVAAIEYCYDGRIRRVEFRHPPPRMEVVTTTASATVAGALSEAG